MCWNGRILSRGAILFVEKVFQSIDDCGFGVPRVGGDLLHLHAAESTPHAAACAGSLAFYTVCTYFCMHRFTHMCVCVVF